MRIRDWIFIAVAIIMGVICIGLGIWQINRRSERLEQNAVIEARLNEFPQPITGEIKDPVNWEYKRVLIGGAFDNLHAIVLRNRSFENQSGVHLITPLILEDSEVAVLVDRGWIPYESRNSEARKEFDVTGTVEVSGIVKLSQPEPSISFLADPPYSPGSPPLEEWRVINVERIQKQIPYTLLPFIVEQSEPFRDAPDLPIPDPDIDLSEGPHLSYAIQWFAFAAIAILGGYLWWRRRSVHKGENPT